MTVCPNGGGNFDAYSTLRTSTPVTLQSKGWPTNKLQPSGCPPHSKEGWLVDCPTLSGDIGAEGLSSPKGFPQNPWLPGSEEGGNDCPGHSSPEVCGPIGNSHGSTLWNRAGGLPVSCSSPWRRQSPEPGNVRHCWEGSHGSCSCFCLCFPYSRAQRGGTDYPTGTWGVMHLRARRSYPFSGRTGPHMGKISISATRVCPLTCKLNPYRFAKGYTPRAWLDLCSLGSLQVTISHYPVVRKVWCEYQSWVITQASLQMPQFDPLEPSDSPPRIQELWVNTMLFLLPTSDSTAPKLLDPQKWLKMHCEFICACDQCR